MFSPSQQDEPSRSVTVQVSDPVLDKAERLAEIHKHRTRNPLVDHHEWLVEALALAKRNERAEQFKPPTGAAA
jgi:hypothetical protein